MHTSFQFNRGIFIKGWDWMFCHVIYTVNHLTICRGRLRGACNQLVTHPTTVVIAPNPVIVMSPHGFNLSFLPSNIIISNSFSYVICIAFDLVCRVLMEWLIFFWQVNKLKLKLSQPHSPNIFPIYRWWGTRNLLLNHDIIGTFFIVLAVMGKLVFRNLLAVKTKSVPSISIKIFTK